MFKFSESCETRADLPLLAVVAEISCCYGIDGAVGRVVDIVFRPGESPSLDGTSWPHMVIVEFPKYTGPLVFPDRPKVISNTEPAVTCLQSVFCKTLL